MATGGNGNNSTGVGGAADKAVGWLTQQNAMTVLVFAIFVVVCYGLSWIATTGYTMYTKQVQDGYERIVDQHKDTVKAIVESNERVHEKDREANERTRSLDRQVIVDAINNTSRLKPKAAP